MGMATVEVASRAVRNAHIEAWACEPGADRREISLDEIADWAGPVWLEVSTATTVDELRRALADLWPDSETKLLEELLDGDEYPERYESTDGTVRAFSAFAVTSNGTIDLQTVEFLAGSRWIATCWHPSRGHQASVRDEVTHEVDRRWMSGEGRTAGDLGILFMHELACTFARGRRRLHELVDAWELAFYERPASADISDLHDVRRLIAELEKRLNELNLPREKAATAWFSDVTICEVAEQVDARIDRALRDLRGLGQELRTSVDLLQSHRLAEQLRLAQKQGEKFELLTALVLVPTLVAGIYGANTELPGATDHRFRGFALLVTLMVAGAALSLTLLRRAGRKDRA
jgi:Mg2+ and Co2+ transporter CorA